MWLPLTWRTDAPVGAELTVFSTSATQGPATLTMTFARTLCVPAASVERGAPRAALAHRAVEARARADVGAAPARGHRGQDHQPRVVDARVGVDEALVEALLEARAPAAALEVDAEGTGQRLAARDVVVEEEPGADHPRRPQVRLVRQHERQRLDEVRRLRDQHLALGERLGHQPELVVLEVAQAAVDQLGAPLRGGRREVVALDEQRREPAAGGVARHARRR